MLIKIYEGEKTRASVNNLLGFFGLFGLPPAPHGHPFFACFAIDENGIAEEKTFANKNEITITNHKERLLTKEIKRMMQEAEYYHTEDKNFLQKAKAMNDLDHCIYKIRDALKEGISSKLC